MNDNENGAAQGGTGSNRRALLKGAVAVGVGAAVYTAPVVSPVPAYATHGLSSWTSQSDHLCFWFSPSHDNQRGDWHLPGALANVFNPVVGGVDYSNDANTRSTGLGGVAKSLIRVGGSWRELHVAGHPNNWDGSTTGGYAGTGFFGGGMSVRLLDPNCEFLLIRFSSGKEEGLSTAACAGSGSLTGFASRDTPINQSSTPGDNLPNPWQGDATQVRYYHTGQPRKPPVPGIVFRIRCR